MWFWDREKIGCYEMEEENTYLTYQFGNGYILFN